MISRFRFNLTFAILASLAALLLLTWILLSIISFKTAEKDLLSARSAHAASMLNLILATLPETIDGAGMSRVAAALKGEEDFASFLLVNHRGDTLFRLSDERALDATLAGILKQPATTSQFSPAGNQVLAYAPLLRNGKVAGAARLALSLDRDHARLARTRTLFLGYFILDFILLLGLGAFMLRRIIVAPLERLLKATERVIDGDYSHQVQLPGCSEISGLADSFNVMQMTLKERRDEVEGHLHSLEQANRALQEARLETLRSEKMASVGLLAAGMAHEIGTPLAGIIGYSGILAEELAEDAEKSDFLRRIADDANRIDRLVKDLLNYARPVKPEIEQIDVKEFLEDLCDMLERQGLFKRLETQLTIAAGLPPLYLDRHQLLQVVMNLVMNARDAMPDGGTLAIAACAGDGESVLLEVTDSGAGILPEHSEKIFEPFFTTKEPGKGTGLGLAISARLVESFGGRIELESRPGQGTKFRLRLPGVAHETAVGAGD
ncbi:MAG: integral rane sensor signal transduction histidine kinase [Deltaproteobacteria bacterium]|nr:integral rane sensor signal transduction histidine kinase [Deltaproteobacteria bacterium]